MPKNVLRLVLLVAAGSGFFFQPPAFSQTSRPTTPEATTKAFYAWFIEHDAGDHGYPLMDKEIYRYVSKPTVDFLRSEYKQNRFAEKAEYFTRVQDYDQQDWLTHIALHPSIQLDDVRLVPVTLGSTNRKTVIAFLRHDDGNWKIVKVDDTQDEK